MSNQGDFRLFEQLGLSKPSVSIPFSLSSINRGENQGSKKNTMQSYKGMNSFKRIDRPIDKSVWGPKGWEWLHKLAVSYPITPSESDINNTNSLVLQFIESLPLRVPCKAHSLRYIKNYPISLETNKSFQIWVWNFHNSINYRVGKKHFSLIEYDRKYKTNFSITE